MRVLVVNAGSSSVKLRVVDDSGATVERADLPAVEEAGDLAGSIAGFGAVDAVGHRVVHGGTDFRDAVLVDDRVVERLTALVELAPLHQPAALSALEQVRRALPAVPHVACFDTAFHAALPEAAATYALPRAWRERWPLRRFGFHGLSHAYLARRAAELLGRPAAELRIVTAHLGAGASLAAVDRGRSADTTMGFTPLEGLVMATRSGNVDPGLVLWLQREAGLTADEVAEGLEHEAGVLGISGSADMRTVIEAAGSGSADAELALEVYGHRLRAGIAAMVAAMDGLDALVFGGGVGENAAGIRASAIRGLGFLGLTIDPGANEGGRGDRAISRAGTSPAALVVETREELEIARQVRELLEARS